MVAGSGSGGSAGSKAGSGGSAAGSGGSGGSSGTGGTAGSRAGSGGSGGSGGSTAGTDAGTDSGTPGAGCAGGGYILCEDFDDTQVGSTPDGWEKHGDPCQVSDEEAVSGEHGLKIGPKDNGERRIYHDAADIPSTHWGRIRFKVELPVPDAFVHSTFVTFTGKSPKQDQANLEVRVVDTVKESKQGFNDDGNGSHYQWLYNVQPQTRDEFGKGGDYSRKFDDAWHCAEWYLDSAEQEYRFFFDGAAVMDIAFKNGAGNYDNSEIPSSFDELRVGWNNYQSAPPGFTAWFDDFAIDDQRIGCE